MAASSPYADREIASLAARAQPATDSRQIGTTQEAIVAAHIRIYCRCNVTEIKRFRPFFSQMGQRFGQARLFDQRFDRDRCVTVRQEQPRPRFATLPV